MHALWRGDYPVAATHRKLNHGRQFSHKFQVQHGGCTSTSTLKLARRVRRVRSNCVLLEVPRHGNVGGGRPERPGRRSGSARRGLWAPKRPFPQVPSKSDPPCRKLDFPKCFLGLLNNNICPFTINIDLDLFPANLELYQIGLPVYFKRTTTSRCCGWF